MMDCLWSINERLAGREGLDLGRLTQDWMRETFGAIMSMTDDGEDVDISINDEEDIGMI